MGNCVPIESNFDVRVMAKARFHEIDFRVMRYAFDIQNEFGRLYDESIYHSELVNRCANEGLSVISEGGITVRHETFSELYFIDALMNEGAIYEFKAVESLNGHHESQLLNYMFLSGLSEGKLLNFSSPSVQHRFVSTTVKATDRYSYEINTDCWEEDCAQGRRVRGIIHDLLADWGAYLDIGLYREAVFHLLGGEDQLLQSVDVKRGSRTVGRQKLHMLDHETSLIISATIHYTDTYRKQLDKLLDHTAVRQIHWVNFSRQRIILTTLKK